MYYFTIIKNRLTVVTYDSTVDVSIKQNYLTQTYMINLFKKSKRLINIKFKRVVTFREEA